jgi:ATP-dependent DNA helicase 2 subunit 2
MAGKEATLVLLDVGASMYERYEAASNQKTKRLDVSVDCLKLMLQNKIFNHKTHEVGLILFGCEESDDQTLYI